MPTRDERPMVDIDPALLTTRANELFLAHRQRINERTDRLFVGLMAVQWLGAIIVALVVSPRTWIGATPFVHIHVWAAFILGGLISSAPILMGLKYAGAPTARFVIAIAQAAWSALLIHLSGGRIETHFHVFGSLAFLSFYRDWRVLIVASSVVALDHFVRGIWWPQSVYGVSLESPFRWIEHAAWVVFEDVFLLIACLRSQHEGQHLCNGQAALELTNAEIEERISRRTSDLECARSQLVLEFEEHRKLEMEREQLHAELMDASRQAGMAEVATGVLHNVGNVLNSVAVSANLMVENLQSSRVVSLARAAKVVEDNEDDLAHFLTADQRGKHFPRLLSELANKISSEREMQREEFQCLISNIEHIKEIVNMQQDYAQLRGAAERVSIVALLEDAMNINDAGLLRHSVDVVRDYEDVPPIVTQRHKVLQILVNLISNAKYALSDDGTEQRTMTLIVRSDGACVQVEVCDNGVGIPTENLTRIFAHGFTTKKDGHGFGLHSSALAAQELGGSLSATSDGPGEGARFTLRLPFESEEAVLNVGPAAATKGGELP